MTCDVIMPVFNNANVLSKTLAALFSQNIPNSWQCRLIISDDGSADDTVVIVQKIEAPANWQKKVITGKHAGPGAARNRGLEIADSDIVFFLGADILLRPGALAHHLTFHEQHPEVSAAALGMVKWDPRLLPTPLMEWMVHGGQQNDFDSLLGKTTADPAHFLYASHVTLKRSLIQNLRFPEHAGYGWEDLMLGDALARRGLKLYVLHQAIGLHHHFYSVEQVAGRQRFVGRNLSHQSIPHRSLFNHLRRALFIVLGGQIILGLILKKFSFRSLPRLFLLFTSTEFWRGMWKSHSGLLPLFRENSRFSL